MSRIEDHQRVHLDWDYESRTAAYDQSRSAAARDPDAAAYLAAHLDMPTEAGQIPAPTNAYDPMALYAMLAKYYGWSHRDIDTTHYVTVFGYAREATLQQETEQRRSQQDQQSPSPQAWD